MNTPLDFNLSQFYGSETFYRHSLLPRVVYTEGVQYLAKKAGAYWLIDKIATVGWYKLKHEEFQTWELTVNKKDDTALLIATDGNKKRLWLEKLDFTDFPLESIKLYQVNGTIMLPSEY